MKCTKIKIVSENEDWNGVWTKADTEQEMRELGCPPKGGNGWVSWIVDHVFWDNDIDQDTANAIVNPRVSKIVFDSAAGYRVNVSKD